MCVERSIQQKGCELLETVYESTVRKVCGVREMSVKQKGKMWSGDVSVTRDGEVAWTEEKW